MATQPLRTGKLLEDICQSIHDATAGFGTNERGLARAIGRIPPGQGDEVMATYKALFGEDLIGLLKSETSFGFEDLLLEMLAPQPRQDAQILFNALQSHEREHVVKIDEDTLIEVLCTRTKAEVAAIVPAFDALIAKEVTPHMPPGGMPVTLRTEIDSPSGPREPLVKRILLAILDGSRDDEPASPDLVDAAAAQRDADALHKAGAGRAGTDEAALVDLFTKRSFTHLSAVAEAYRKSYGHRLPTDIKGEFRKRSKSRLALKTLALRSESIGSPVAFMLREAINGIGTNDRLLERAMCRLSSCEDRTIVAETWKRFPDIVGKPDATPVAWVKGDVGPGKRRELYLAILEQGQPPETATAQ
jgi:hypothetical protein